MKKGKKNKDNFEKMCKEIITFIESKGGKVFVIGSPSIGQRGRKNNFSFTIDFTGHFPIEIFSGKHLIK